MLSSNLSIIKIFLCPGQVKYATITLLRDAVTGSKRSGKRTTTRALCGRCISAPLWERLPKEIQSEASSEACSSALGLGFPVVREARGNERVWSHLNSAGRVKSSEADLRRRNNIPGLHFSGLDLLPASVVYVVLSMPVDIS